jgi:cyclopropane-fatty-acyl-phospholipid synthase
MQYYLNQLQTLLFNNQKKSRAFIVGEQHYDLGNDLFSLMLDKELNYTCGYWKDVHDLESAQSAKLRLVCEKLNLKPGQKILDIGCGFGAFARFAVENYQVSVVGVTISKNQKKLADERCKGLPIEIRIQDYRDINEQFDNIVSLGMFEHVGYKNYQTYMDIVQRCLRDSGLFLLHTIGNNTSVTYANSWITKYIFPNGMLPSITQIGTACEGKFVMEDWHNFGPDYEKTLLVWHENFNRHWPELKSNYSERFKRMWDYYLLSCAGAFRARTLQLWQIVLSKTGILGPTRYYAR